ncbi:MAG: hypothetical protein ABIM85_06785 [candidate division WOR-3 bacterium]
MKKYNNLTEWYKEFIKSEEGKAQMEKHNSEEEKIKEIIKNIKELNEKLYEFYENNNKDGKKAGEELMKYLKTHIENVKWETDAGYSVTDPLSLNGKVSGNVNKLEESNDPKGIGALFFQIHTQIYTETESLETFGTPSIDQRKPMLYGKKDENKKCPIAWGTFEFIKDLKDFESLKERKEEFKELIKKLGKFNRILTQELYWVRPDIFCPWDSKLENFAKANLTEKSVYSKKPKIKFLEDYINYLEEVHNFKDFAYPTVWFCRYIFEFAKGIGKSETKNKEETKEKHKENSSEGVEKKEEKLEGLSSYFKSKGFYFAPFQISSFYTALKTKGFVILAGLSGTGKTKMAQLFAEGFYKPALNKPALNKPALIGSKGSEKEGKETLEEMIENLKNGKNIFLWTASLKRELYKELKKYLPFNLYLYDNESKKIIKKFDVINMFKKDEKNISEFENKLMNPSWKDSFNLAFEIKSFCDIDYDFSEYTVELIDKEEFKKGKIKKGKTKKIKELGQEVKATQSSFILVFDFDLVKPSFFLSVRPDWRDSKSLIGYYNPIMNRYEDPTGFLKFILNAIIDYKENKDKASPYFVILDEMNLARVEYYFAEFLSVLESGRDEEGFTKEGIRIQISEKENKKEELKDDLKDLLKKANYNYDEGIINLKLPPNLYFIGTVNIDETTFMFSPKVLDRAFVIEFKDVSFKEYINILKSDKISFYFNENIVKDFTQNGEFLKAYSEKNKIKEALDESTFKEYLSYITNLSKNLEPYSLHFGYRVLDEIALFYKNAKDAEKNKIISFKNDDEIFDLAILMKVLPKFHGNRAKLEAPLYKVLYWCKKPGNQGEKKLEDIKSELGINEIEKIEDEIKKLKNNQSDWRFSHTALKVLEMLYELFMEGYAGYL